MNDAIPSLHLWLIPLLPALGFLLNGLFGRRLPKALVSGIALLFTALPFCQVVSLAWRFHSLRIPYIERFATPWIAAGTYRAGFNLALDQLTLVMLLVVTGVGFLIHLYSVGYMAEEEGFWRFFAYLNLFMFFMLTLVLAEDFLLMFVGWEGVGLASYLLIGFYFQRKSAADAGKKAFIVNRIGDFGFLLAMFLMIAHFGSLSFSNIFPAIVSHPGDARRIHHRDRTAFALGSRGQIGADSALCLAARCHGGPDSGLRSDPCRHHGDRRRLHDRARTRALQPLAVCSGRRSDHRGATAFLRRPSESCRTTSSACLPTRPSRSSATCFWPAAAAAYSAAIFHLVTHAFFKGLLFLAAGSVIHALGGEQDMRRMGGLRKALPVTFWTMTAAVFAISASAVLRVL